MTSLGIAQGRLGEREAGRARLEEAVAAYRAALEEWTRERIRQNGRGAESISAMRLKRSATGRAGQRGSRRRSRPIARRCEEWTRERVPLDGR